MWLVFALVVPAVSLVQLPLEATKVELHKEGHFDHLSCFMYYAQGRASGGSILVK